VEEEVALETIREKEQAQNLIAAGGPWTTEGGEVTYFPAVRQVMYRRNSLRGPGPTWALGLSGMHHSHL
jgi:hypothetical protein